MLSYLTMALKSKATLKQIILHALIVMCENDNVEDPGYILWQEISFFS